MRSSQILIIDDEVQIRKLLRILLESNEYKVEEAENAKTGIQLAANLSPDLILLDVGLPDMSGVDLIKHLREWYTKSIIVLSVQDNEDIIIQAIDNGANDYIVKPFRTRELLARMRSALRAHQKSDENQCIHFEDLKLDLNAKSLQRGTELIKLTNTEYKLLELLAINAGKVLTHKYILNEIWGLNYQQETQYLRVFVAQLRKKIENDSNSPRIIRTESGIGYRLIGLIDK